MIDLAVAGQKVGGDDGSFSYTYTTYTARLLAVDEARYVSRQFVWQPWKLTTMLSISKQ